MAKKLEIVIEPFKDFYPCSNCRKYGMVEGGTPQSIALTVTSVGDKGVKSPPVFYCFNCANKDFIADIKQDLSAIRKKEYSNQFENYSKVEKRKWFGKDEN